MFSYSFSQTEAEPGDIIITEIFTRSNGNIPDYIEVYNRSLFSHSLFGWKISIYGTEYTLNNSASVDVLNLSPFHYLIITGRDGYFTDEDMQLHIAIGDERLDTESEEYNSGFASFVANNGGYAFIENAVWAPFALSHSGSEIKLINNNDIVIDFLPYNSTQYQIGGSYTGHSIELTDSVTSTSPTINFDPSEGHNPEWWEYSRHSRPFMFSSDGLYTTDNYFMEFGSPGKRNYLKSAISVKNLQCGPDPNGSEFCTSPGASCVSQNQEYNEYDYCIDYYDQPENDGDVEEFWEFYTHSQTGLCWYECEWSDNYDNNNMNINNPIYNIYHDRIPGGTKSLLFDASQSISNVGDEIISYKWYKNGNVFQNGITIESEFAQGAHELVLLIKNEDDIWAVDTFNFEVKEPNKEPSPIITVDANEYVVAHNGDPAPAATGITLSGVNSCDCNDFIRYEFFHNGIFFPNDYDCSCLPINEGDDDWVNDLKEICEINLNQVDCEQDFEYCWWNPDGESSLTETNGACEYSEIEYFFWTKNGEIQGTSKEFVSYIPDIGEYVFSLILTDTYGENNSASTEITIKKELNYPPKANIVGTTTIPDHMPPNGIPYGEDWLELHEFDESYDVQLSEGQNSDDIIFSQWYTIEGEPINADENINNANEAKLGLGTYTFILEVLDSYNCYSKNNYGSFLNMCGTEPCVEVCYEIESQSDCVDTYSGCRWNENSCTPYCELYAQGFCDGLGGIPNNIPCHKSGINFEECGDGGSCIFHDEFCSQFEVENHCKCGNDGEWDSDEEECILGEEYENCSWEMSNNPAIAGVCIGDLQSASYDTLTVILSEENSPPIADIGTSLFEYMEEEQDFIIPSLYDIEFYNAGGDGECFPNYETAEICDPTISPIFPTDDGLIIDVDETRRKKCCVQVEWEVIASHYGKDQIDFSDENNDGVDDDWHYCLEDDITHPYCNGDWLRTPTESTLEIIPPENTDFYPDSVRLRLTATDPFFNSGYSELFGQDEVIIIIENDNKPPEQVLNFNQDGYRIYEDSSSTFLDIELSEFFIDPDGEVLDFAYHIENNQLIDTSAILLDEDGFILDGELHLQNIMDKNGDLEVFVYALDSEYTIQASFNVLILPMNDIPNVKSTEHNLDECITDCSISANISPKYFVLDGDPGGCGIEDECEDGNLSFEITRYPLFGLVEPIPEVTIEEAYNYYPYQDFFGYDTVFFQITDIGSSYGIVDTTTSETGYIIFYVEKSDNNAPIVQRTNFTVKEDYLIHFTAHEDSITYIDSLNHIYLGLDVLDDDNNCLSELNTTCNDSLFNSDVLKVYVQHTSGNNEFFTIIDTSIIQIYENYNNSLTVPILVRDHELELGNFESDEYQININLIPVNDKPIAENSAHQLLEDEILEFELIGEDYENNSLSFEIIKLPTRLDSIFPHPQLTDNILFEFDENPLVRYAPLKDYNGLDSLIYIIHDDGTTNGEPDSLTSDSIIVMFDIEQVNDPPRIDTIYFESDTLISSLKEDTSDVKVYMVYTDIDSDEDLNQNQNGPSDFNLTWEFNTPNNESGLKFWFKNEPPIVEEFYQNPLRRLGLFTIDSLLENWNGTDTSIIKISDSDGLSENYKFGLTIDAVNDPPEISSMRIDTAAIDSFKLWEFDYDEFNEVILAEDSKNIPLIIEYFDIDTDSNLNENPDTIAGFSWDLSSIKNRFSASYQVIFDQNIGTDVFKFTLDSITNNWNGYDTLVTIITDTIGDSFYHNLGLQVYQVNDSPEPFNYYSQINKYPFNAMSNSFYESGNTWTFRLPYQENAIFDENSEELLIKWKRTTDIDLVDSLNNHQNKIVDLFYRVELIGDKSGYTYVLKSRINDSLFNKINYCPENLEITSEDCIDLGIIDSSYGFTKIDLTESFLTYKGSYFDSLYPIPDTLSQKLDLSNNKDYYCNNGTGISYGNMPDCNNICPESCSNTDYRLNIVAYNASREDNPDDPGGDEGFDFHFIDSPQYADLFNGDSSNFNVDLTLPNFQFNVIRNDIFWEYYDLYITNSEPILDFLQGIDYNPLLLIENQNGLVDTIRTTSSENGPIHYTSQFKSEDSITFIYSARDLVENYGVSSKTISYAIIEPMEKSIILTPSQNSQISFEIGSVSQVTGIISEDIKITNENINGIGVSFLPKNQPIISKVKLSFNLNLIDFPISNSWNYELFKKVNGNWENMNLKFEKINGFIHTYISELGEFALSYNEDLEKPLPPDFVIHPNYPNPFNGITTIRFELPESKKVNLNIINILGENVRTIYSGSLTADFHSFNWDGMDSQMKSVASGVYFVELNLNNKKYLQKIMYMK